MTNSSVEHSSFAQVVPSPKLQNRARILPILLLTFVFSVLGTVLAAQSNIDEFNLVKGFVLPKTAVPISDLTIEDDIYAQQGTLFTGIAYERFDNGKLSRLVSLYHGRQNGPMYLWYPDGTPQMSTNYRGGRLQGRFLGWYMNGGIIYDMVINQGGYAGDFIENDAAAAADESLEGEGDASDLSEGE